MSDKNPAAEKAANEQKAIRVCLVSEIPAYYRSYYKNEETGEFYSLTNFRSTRTWHTTSGNGEQPDMPLKDGLLIEIMSGEEVISRERITRVGDDAIGEPIIDLPEPDAKPRRGKKTAADTPGDPVG